MTNGSRARSPLDAHPARLLSVEPCVDEDDDAGVLIWLDVESVEGETMKLVLNLPDAGELAGMLAALFEGFLP